MSDIQSLISSDVAVAQMLIENYALPWGVRILQAIVLFVVGKWMAGVLRKSLERLLKRLEWDPILIGFLSTIAYGAMLVAVVIAALHKLGVDTTSLVALIGAAGIAVGLALKDSLQNFSAGIMLIVFRPFKNGDYVEAADTAGIVQHIGIFSTTFLTPDNREVIVPNQGIYSGNIINFSAKPTRRIDLKIGIGYDDDIKLAKEVLEGVARNDSRVLADPPPLIAVAELGDNSVNFVVRVWVKTEEYWPVTFDLTERIKLAFDEQGVGIPFPQIDVHIREHQRLEK